MIDTSNIIDLGYGVSIPISFIDDEGRMIIEITNVNLSKRLKKLLLPNGSEVEIFDNQYNIKKIQSGHLFCQLFGTTLKICCLDVENVNSILNKSIGDRIIFLF